jgi:hypothetical protein
MNQRFKPNNYSLLLLWIIQCVIVLLCCFLNPNHFTTIDSQYYLESAQNILNGNGYTRLENGIYTWNSTFPPGYSILISFVAFVTSLPVLWASKVLNLLASGIWFWQLRKWYGSDKALLTGSLLLFGSFLKLWCHTWSEPLFLVLLFNWAQVFFAERRKFVTVLSLGVALISVRYAGVFIIALSLGMSVFWFRKDQKRAWETLALSLSWSIFIGSWLLINYHLSGEFYGSERFGQSDKISEVVILIGKGLANEFFLFGDTNWQRIDVLFFFEILVQFFFFFQLYKALYKLPKADHFMLSASTYLAFLIVMRAISPFDPPGYRILSPFSFLIGCSLLANLYNQFTTTRFRKVYLGLVLFSWLHLLPQADTSEKIQLALKRLVAINPNIP